MKKSISPFIAVLFLLVAISAQAQDKGTQTLEEKEQLNKPQNLRPSNADKEGQGQRKEYEGKQKEKVVADGDQPVIVNKAKEFKESPFETFKLDFIEMLWRTYPGWATSSGFHKYDSLLVIPDKESRETELRFCKTVDSWMQRLNFDSLKPNEKTDYRLIENFLAGVRFNVNEFKSYEWDPSSYNIGGGIFDILDYNRISLKDKMLSLKKKLSYVPEYYKAAKATISNPTKEHTQLAIKQNEGSLYFFDKVLSDSLVKSGLNSADQREFKANADKAKVALQDYVAFLKNILTDTEKKEARSFRIGKELYEKKFALDINSQYTAEEMYKKAEQRKEFVQGEMFTITQKLWSQYMGTKEMPKDKLVAVKEMIDALSVKHCKREDFITTIEKQLPELTEFINDRQLIDLDSSKPLKVRKTPEYMAGVAGASINSPGPYDRLGTTYYNVTPLTNYTAEQAESYLREYNDYVLPILNIHEAIPGHYTQGIYANRSASMIKTILGNGATIEGWACYVERMMIEQGFHDSPEMLLFYYKWNLREACNFILDYNVHCNNWSEKEVRNLLVNEAFQQETEAAEKYKRVTLSQVQLTSYFTGLTEIYELREELRAKLDKKFTLKKFHEKFLSFGSAPVKEIRTLLMRNR